MQKDARGRLVDYSGSRIDGIEESDDNDPHQSILDLVRLEIEDVFVIEDEFDRIVLTDDELEL